MRLAQDYMTLDFTVKPSHLTVAFLLPTFNELLPFGVLIQVAPKNIIGVGGRLPGNL